MAPLTLLSVLLPHLDLFFHDIYNRKMGLCGHVVIIHPTSSDSKLCDEGEFGLAHRCCSLTDTRHIQ